MRLQSYIFKGPSLTPFINRYMPLCSPYAGPNGNKITQNLVEIKHEILSYRKHGNHKKHK